MKTIPTELICNRPDGWEVWCFTDAGKFHRRFVQKDKPSMEQIMAWVDTLPDEPEPVVLPENTELASLAVAAKAILERSSKLQSPEILGMLDQLVAGVKSVAQADPDDGTAATRIVEKMLADPQLQAQPELHSAIAAALINIQTMTGGVL